MAREIEAKAIITNNANVKEEKLIILPDSANFPLALTLSIEDYQKLENRTGVFSKTAEAPGTKDNCETLKHIWNIDLKSSFVEELKTKVPVTLFERGIEVFKGFFRVDAIILKKRIIEKFNLLFFGENFGWMDGMKDMSIKSLDFGTHDFTKQNIEASWVGNADTMDYFYSLKDFGGFKNGSYTTVEDMRPDIYFKNIFKKAFTSLGFTIQSVFFETAFFKSLVLFLSFKESILEADKVVNEFTASNPLFEILNEGESHIFEYVLYSGANFTEQKKFTATKKGKYKFRGTGEFETYTEFIGGDHIYSNHYFLKNGTPFGLNINASLSSATGTSDHQINANYIRVKMTMAYQENPRTFNVVLQTDFIFLNIGDTVEFGFEFDDSANNAPSSQVEGTQIGTFSNEFSIAIFSEGSNLDLSDLLIDRNVFDLLKDAIILFNLYIRTDNENKIVFIEPRETFFKDISDAIDWSGKIDETKETKISFIRDLKIEQLFRYAKDSKDKGIELDEQGLLRPLLSFLKTLTSRFAKGRDEISTKVIAATATTYNTAVANNSGGILMPKLWNKDVAPTQSFEFAPRLFSVKYTSEMTRHGSTPAWKWYSVGNVLSTYPKAFTINFDNAADKTLSFSDELVGVTNVSGIVTLHYKKYLDILQQGILVEAYLDIRNLDMKDIDLRIPVFIDGNYFIRSKIIDYKPLKDETTRCELLKISNFVD